MNPLTARLLLLGIAIGANLLCPRLQATLPTGMNSGAQLETTPHLRDAATGAFSYTRLQSGVQFRSGELVKNVLFYAPDIVRVNTNHGISHTLQPSLVVILSPGAVDIKISDKPETLELTTQRIRVLIEKNSGALSFLRSDGTLITCENQQRATEVKRVKISGEPSYEVRQSFTLTPDESLYGLGQYNQRYCDYRGQKVLLVQTNIGIVIPLLVSTRNYGIMWDIYSKSVFEDTAQGASFWSESAPAGVDYYLIAGASMDGVIAGYRQLTGAAPMFPKSAFGLWMSKERYKTQDELLSVVRRFREEGIPIDNIVQDWQYWGGDKDGTWSGMTWNQERFPDPRGLIKSLHEEYHVKLMNSIWPSVGDDTELAKELDAEGLRFKPLHWISKKARVYDAFSARGREIYFKHIKKGLLDVGVDALWMDGTEVEVDSACHEAAKVEADIKSLGKNALGDFTRYLNPYTLLTTKGTYEGQRSTSNKRVFTLTRSAFTGQQRYGALSWSGDTTASWEVFRDQISGGVNVSLAGQAYWTQDTGGFFIPGKWRSGADKASYNELFARWHQFGAMNPIYRIHGTDIVRELYQFKDDAEVYQSLITANHLRYRLIPYLYSLAWKNTSEAYTLMRGLPMDFPEDAKLRKVDDAYLLGPALLVHPITHAIYRLGTPPPVALPAAVLQTTDGRPGVSVEYFEGCNFEKSVSKAVDAMVDYTWPGPPLADLPKGLSSVDNFSGRWEGIIKAPEDGEYELGAEADDGVRLWLEGRLIVDDWGTHAMRYHGTKLKLSKGQKLGFKIEYFQGTGGRGLRLAWKTPSQIAGEKNAPAEVKDRVETYLPRGADWYDFWTNEQFTGGQTISKACPLDTFPLYVRAGSIVPLSPVMQYTTEKPGAPYEIRVYPGADGRFVLYEDDNETYDYEKGLFATVEFSWDEAARTFTVGERQGDFPGLVRERELHIIVVNGAHGQGLRDNTGAGRALQYTGKKVSVKF